MAAHPQPKVEKNARYRKADAGKEEGWKALECESNREIGGSPDNIDDKQRTDDGKRFKRCVVGFYRAKRSMAISSMARVPKLSAASSR